MPSEVAAAESRIEAWFESNGMEPFGFQRRAWAAIRAGKSGLVHASTGTGKTCAVWIGALLDWMETGEPAPRGLRVLWVTPLRALARDTLASLRRPVEDLELPWTVEMRTGDTSSAARARQKRYLPSALVTTPESLSLLLSYPDAAGRFAGLSLVVVDEWHELLGTKRGVQTELALARLRRLAPRLRVFGLSATLGNLDEALETLVGVGELGGAGAGAGRATSASEAVLVRGDVAKDVRIETLLPEEVEALPYAGHIGLRMLPRVIEEVASARTTLVFTNTRSQAEVWYREMLDARPDWAGEIALHHGSIDRRERGFVERALDEGRLRCVVCTSSLDLGVDFAPVEQVLQIGSPKGVARLLQRAGRSGHRPGVTSRVACVPSHAFELVEFAAARDAAAAGEIEARRPLEKPLDVLLQHLVGSAAAGGFDPDAAFEEVRTTRAYRDLARAELDWAIDFLTTGGRVLAAYPEYERLERRDDGTVHVRRPAVARRHRMTVGTITSDASLQVRFAKGGVLGSIEERFVSRLRPGDAFWFAGRALELVRVRDMTVTVRKARSSKGAVPQWIGGRMPLSSRLSRAVRRKLLEAREGRYDDPELRCARPVLELQRATSAIPGTDELLVERATSRDGRHLFLYPFEGRRVHEGLGMLFAWRIARDDPRTLRITSTDYGLELLAPGADAEPIELDDEGWRRLLDPGSLAEDILDAMNASEMARRRFRDIARVAGLVFAGYPGQSKSARQLQTSSGLLFDVFRKYDEGNLLLEQANREVLEGQLEVVRLREALERMRAMRRLEVETRRLTPFAFPLFAERIRAQLSTEKWMDRLRRMAVRIEADAGR